MSSRISRKQPGQIHETNRTSLESGPGNNQAGSVGRTDQHSLDVSRMARRIALLYRHFAEAMKEELGPSRAREITRKAIDAYGAQIGREVKEKNTAAGVPLSAANYADDIPAVGWVMEPEIVNGEATVRVNSCPIADELKGMDPELARIYCYVDQAKMEGYNPNLVYIHLKNMLDGDAFCRHVIRPRKRPPEK